MGEAPEGRELQKWVPGWVEGSRKGYGGRGGGERERGASSRGRGAPEKGTRVGGGLQKRVPWGILKAPEEGCGRGIVGVSQKGVWGYRGGPEKGCGSGMVPRGWGGGARKGVQEGVPEKGCGGVVEGSRKGVWKGGSGGPEKGCGRGGSRKGVREGMLGVGGVGAP